MRSVPSALRHWRSAFHARSESHAASSTQIRSTVQRAEGVAIRACRPEVQDAPVREFQAEVGLTVNLRFAVLRDRDAVHQVIVVVKLELDLLDNRIEVPLVRRGDEPLPAARDEREMQHLRREVDGFPNGPGRRDG